MTINFSGMDSVLDAFSMADLFALRGDNHYVKKIASDDYPALTPIIDVWKEIACQKAKCAKTSTETTQFRDCNFILDIVSYEMNSKKIFISTVYVQRCPRESSGNNAD